MIQGQEFSVRRLILAPIPEIRPEDSAEGLRPFTRRTISSELAEFIAQHRANSGTRTDGGIENADTDTGQTNRTPGLAWDAQPA